MPPYSPSWKRNSDNEEDDERDRRLAERWRYDADDYPPFGPEGSDEQDRVLIDDYDTRFVLSQSRVTEVLII
jgi:hypothetical protein